MTSIFARNALRTGVTAPRVAAGRFVGTDSKASETEEHEANPEQEANSEESNKNEQPKQEKTMAQKDEELKQKMSGLSGDGGEAGLEFEDGQAVSGLGKRSVRNNIFRYI